jgi:hypothetical protein
MTPSLDQPWVRPNRITENNLQFAGIALVALAGNLSEVVVPDSAMWRSALAHKRYARSNGLRTLWFRKDAPNNLYLSQYQARPSPSNNPISKMLQRGLDPNALPELEHILLDVEKMHEDTLYEKLMHCGMLKGFTCRWGGYELRTEWSELPQTPEEPDVVDLSMFSRTLSRFKDSLTSLTIDTMEAICQIDMEEDIPAIGSLREFTSLKHFDVSGLVLWGDCEELEFPRLSGVLPESLETLTIKTEWDDDVEDALYNLCEDAFAVPRLRTLTCTWGPAPRATAEALISAFRKINVELVLSIDKM